MENVNRMKFSWLLPILILLILSPACRMLSPKVPPELIGTWRSADPRYQDKFMTFDSGYVTLGLGEDHTPGVGRVTSIASSVEAGVSTYVIESRDQEDHLDKITVHYSPLRGGELRLSNQTIWKKDAPGADQ